MALARTLSRCDMRKNVPRSVSLDDGLCLGHTCYLELESVAVVFDLFLATALTADFSLTFETGVLFIVFFAICFMYRR